MPDFHPFLTQGGSFLCLQEMWKRIGSIYGGTRVKEEGRRNRRKFWISRGILGVELQTV